jgi:NAD(P)-dependent dehydrogenase (short-subunit alcohol dehydrogenase family)
MRLDQKVALVMGAGQAPGASIGNGKATALLFASHGARIVAADISERALEETCAEIEKAGGSAVGVVADVSMEADVEKCVDKCVKVFGTIDVLHNNVGIGSGDGDITTLSQSTWNRIFAVNLTGAMLGCKHVLPIMRQNGTGSIVNVSSISAVAASRFPAYKASKSALNALTQQLALENAPFGIRVNAIMPGGIDTPQFVAHMSGVLNIEGEEVRRARNARVPLRGRMGTGWDSAYAALFLASEESQFITGALIPVDGGQTLRSG